MSRLILLSCASIIVCTLSGCTLSDNVWWTNVAEPIHYPRYWEDKCQQQRFREMAREALVEARALAKAETDDYEHEPFSIDQERGFEDGFVDHLIAGGTGQPPPLPPRRYWKAKYQTPEGQRAIQQWFRGYEHGAGVAEASGLRNLVTVPSSDLLKTNSEPFYLGQNASRRSKEFEFEEIPPAQAASPSAAAPLHLDNDITSLTNHQALNRSH